MSVADVIKHKFFAAPAAKPRVHTCSGGQMPERPETDSPGYKRVVARGCLGTTDYWGEADCIYGWTCEECPVLREKWRQEDQQNEAEE